MKPNAWLVPLICLITSNAWADIVLVGNANLSADQLNHSLVSKIYLGRAFSLPDGTPVMPIERNKHDPIKKEFHQKLHSRSLNQLNSYWSRLIFTGRNPPPAEVESDEDVLQLVKHQATLVGYIRSENLTPDVKVLLRLK